MANKSVNELVTSSGILREDDYIVVYDTSESGSEKLKKRPISDYISVVNSSLILYVATTGSDTTGNGSSSTPWATINKAVDWMKNKFITPPTSITIQLSDGTYNNCTATAINFTRKLRIIGNAVTPSNVVLNFAQNSAGISVSEAGYTYISGLKLVGNAKAEGQTGIAAHWGGVTIQVGNIILDNWGNGLQVFYRGHMYASDSTITNCNNGVHAGQHASAHIGSSTITNCSSAGVTSEQMAGVTINSITFSDNANDTLAASGGIITTTG